MVVVAGFVVASSTVYAGYRSERVGLQYSVKEGWFMGSFGAVRNTPDYMTLIGCTLISRSGSDPWAECSMRDDETRLICATFDPALIDTVRGLGTDDMVYVSVDLDDGHCTEITVSRSSVWEPKQL